MDTVYGRSGTYKDVELALPLFQLLDDPQAFLILGQISRQGDTRPP
jgi:hypothetical protein